MLAALYQNNHKTQEIEEEDPDYINRCNLRLFLLYCLNSGKFTDEEAKTSLNMFNNTYKTRGKM
jgi:hypothetical protein